MRLSQILCRHLWKEVSHEFLYWRREQDGGVDLGSPTYSNFEFRAVTEACVKCKRIRIVRRRVSWGRLLPPEAEPANYDPGTTWD